MQCLSIAVIASFSGSSFSSISLVRRGAGKLLKCNNAAACKVELFAAWGSNGRVLRKCRGGAGTIISAQAWGKGVYSFDAQCVVFAVSEGESEGSAGFVVDLQLHQQ